MSTDQPMRRRRRVLLLVAGLALAAVAAVGGTRLYRNHQASTSALPAVKLTSIHMANMLQMMDSSTATFNEFFTKAENVVAEIDKASVSLRSTADQEHPTVAGAVAYMATAQEAARASSLMLRKKMLLRSAVKAMDDAKDDYDAETSRYLNSFHIKRMTKTVDEAKEALDASKKATKDAHAALQALATHNSQAAEAFGPANLIDPKLLASVIQATAPEDLAKK